MHHFLNSFLWSIITNRTVLYQYLDEPTCRYYQATQKQILWQDAAICAAANQKEDCDALLQRFSWMPSFAKLADNKLVEWSTTNLNVTLTMVDYWSVHSYGRAPGWERNRFPLLHNDTERLSPSSLWPKVDELSAMIVDFPELVGKDDTTGKSIRRDHSLATADAKERAEKLMGKGTEFLFGMLYKDMFRYRWEGAEAQKTPIDEGSILHKSSNSTSEDLPLSCFSIALYSRHRKGEDDTNMKNELKCLDRMLRPRNESHACWVCLMSYRPVTIDLLSNWLIDNYQCRIVVADSSETDLGGSFLAEHGPKAGAAFFRELDLCQHFTNGFIGTGGGSTSTSLLEEWVEYNRIMRYNSHQPQILASFDNNDNDNATQKSSVDEDDAELETLKNVGYNHRIYGR